MTTIAWFVPAVVAVVSLIVLGIAFFAARRPQPATAGGDGAAAASVSPRGRRLAKIVNALAIITTLFTVLGVLISVVQALLTDAVTLGVPVRPFRPGVSEGIENVDGQTAEIVGGPGFSMGQFDVEGLDVAARVWLSAGHVANGIAIVFVLVLIANLAQRALDAEPFARPLSPLLARTGIVLGAGSVVWQVCYLIAGNLAAIQLFEVTGFQAADESVLDRNTQLGLGPSGLPAAGYEGLIEFWPIGVALALLALALHLRTGERLQRDTQGLV